MKYGGQHTYWGVDYSGRQPMFTYRLEAVPVTKTFNVGDTVELKIKGKISAEADSDGDYEVELEDINKDGTEWLGISPKHLTLIAPSFKFGDKVQGVSTGRIGVVTRAAEGHYYDVAWEDGGHDNRLGASWLQRVAS